MVEIKLRPMNEAPKDREIFAVYLNRDCYGLPIKDSIDHGNFHPIEWKDYKWIEGYRPHWGMRWNDDFQATLADYAGWFDPKGLNTCSLAPRPSEIKHDVPGAKS